jgi:hypothetical protein
MTDISDHSMVTDGAPNRVTDELPIPPGDAEVLRLKLRYYRHLIKVPQAVARGGRWVACPYCRGRIEICLWGYSGLGPSLLECHRCGEVMLSHRREWAEMTWQDRLGYVWMSLIYAGLSLFTGGLAGYASWGDRRPLPTVARTWLLLLSPVAVFSVQTFRVLRSMYRTRRGRPTPHSTSLCSLDLGLQWKFVFLQILASIVLPTICYLVYR